MKSMPGRKLKTSQIRNDLASVFQDELELKDVSSGLNEWMITPEEMSEQDTSNFEVPVKVINEEVFTIITFSLKPDSKENFLHGRIKDDLRNWIPVICDQYCWQLDFLSIRPKQLSWRLRDFPKSLICEMYKIVRDRTSEQLFQVFPELRLGNTSGDFWSPGYYVDAEL